MSRKLKANNELLFKIFGVSIHTYIILFLYRNRDFFGTLSDIARALNLTHASVRKVVDDLAEIRILKKIRIGNSIVVQFDHEGPFTKPLLEFLEKIHQVEEVRKVEFKR